jgi:hypothetical protein
MGNHHEIEIKEEHYSFSGRAKKVSLALMGVGLVLFLISIFTMSKEETLCCIDHKTAPKSALVEHDSHADNHGEEAHEDAHAEEADHQVEEGHEEGHHSAIHTKPWTARVWTNLLMNGYYMLILGAGGLFFVALQYIANAGWATVVKRVPEAMATVLPWALGIILVVLFFGRNEIYHFAEYFSDKAAGAEGFHEDALMEGKAGFLNTSWLLFGTLAIVGVWIYFAFRMRQLSKQEDAEGGLVPFNKTIRNSAVFTLLFAFSFSVLSWLLIMSVDAHWFSTIFSVYNFAIAFVTALTVICMIVLFLKSQGYLKVVTDEHVHDLGKFMFAFSIFWGYIWVSQYLLIWYANIPEESVYFDTRYYPEWKPMFGVNVILNFLAPFLLLMTRDGKRNPKILIIAAICILGGHWNDIYLMLMPGAIGPAASIGLLEIGTTLMFAGLFIFLVFRALSKQSLVAVNHPYITESAHHDVGP